ncbi:MAG: anti-sigma factor family protein [Opitutaceae bacterium]
MNDTEFIQLLNLYLDHEISTADSARLEAEVQRNAARRHVYQQYCRMQKACRMIASDFQTDSADAVVPAEKKIIAFNPAVVEAAARRRKRAAIYGSGSFAALAACVALVFAGRSQQPSAARPASSAAAPVAATSVVAPSSPISNPDATFIASKSATPRGLVSLAPRPQPMMRDPLFLSGRTHAGADLDAAGNQAGTQLASWINSVQLAPLHVGTPADLNFTSTFGSEGRALGNRQSTPVKSAQPGDEYLGFQFVK